MDDIAENPMDALNAEMANMRAELAAMRGKMLAQETQEPNLMDGQDSLDAIDHEQSPWIPTPDCDKWAFGWTINAGTVTIKAGNVRYLGVGTYASEQTDVPISSTNSAAPDVIYVEMPNNPIGTPTIEVAASVPADGGGYWRWPIASFYLLGGWANEVTISHLGDIHIGSPTPPT